MKNYKDLRQTQNHSKYMKALGWQVDVVGGNYIYVKKLLFWKFIKIQRPYNLVGSELLGYLERNYHLSTVYIEPYNVNQYNDLLNIGFSKYNQPFLPSKTVQIDLTKSEDALLKEMHHKTRYNIKKFSNNNFQFSDTKEYKKFADFWQKSARDRGMFLSQKKEILAIASAFGNDAVIHVIKKDNQWLSAILRISTKDISYYMYAASTKEGKKSYAPTLVAWKAVMESKKEKKKVFDFEGIFDERFPLTTWKGFTRFKKGFGGKEAIYPGVVSKYFL